MEESKATISRHQRKPSQSASTFFFLWEKNRHAKKEKLQLKYTAYQFFFFLTFALFFQEYSRSLFQFSVSQLLFQFSVLYHLLHLLKQTIYCGLLCIQYHSNGRPSENQMTDKGQKCPSDKLSSMKTLMVVCASRLFYTDLFYPNCNKSSCFISWDQQVPRKQQEGYGFECSPSEIASLCYPRLHEGRQIKQYTRINQRSNQLHT